MLKKTRQRTYRPVTRRIKRQLTRHRDLKKNLHDPILRQHWDNNKTITQNLSSIGIENFLNRCPLDYTPVQSKLSEQDLSIVRRLKEKYDDNYQEMARDIKLNYWQWTASVCKSKMRLFNSSQEDTCMQSIG